MKNNKNFSPNSSAFSIIELAVVLTIITVLTVGVMTGQKVIYATKLATARSLTANSPVKYIEDLALWLETTSKDSFDADEAIDGASVATWYDINSQSIYGADATQSTAADQPTYDKDAINGLPALSFDGSNDYLSYYNSFMLRSDYTIFMVEQRGSGGISYILGTEEVFSLTGTIIRVGWMSDTQLLCEHNNYTSSLPINPFFSGVRSTNTISSYTSPISRIHTCTYNSVNGSKYYINGANVTGSSVSGGTYKNYDTTAIGLGEGRYYKGDIGEIITYNRTLSTDEIEAVVEYLSKKWRIDLD